MTIFRKFCQIFVLVFFCCLPFSASLGFLGVKGSFFSLDFFGVPFSDPASSVQVAGQAVFAGTELYFDFLIGAAVSLLLAFFMGRVFCGWICPYGFFSELFSGRMKNDKFSEYVKLSIFLVLLIFTLVFDYPLITLISMPGQITVAPIVWKQDIMAALFILLIPFLALLIDIILRRRFFCSTICPQSLFLSFSASALPKFLPGLRIKWHKDKCSCKGAKCEKICQFGLSPRKNPARGKCVMCGDCVAICAKHGKALAFDIKAGR